MEFSEPFFILRGSGAVVRYEQEKKMRSVLYFLEDQSSSFAENRCREAETEAGLYREMIAILQARDKEVCSGGW